MKTNYGLEEYYYEQDSGEALESDNGPTRNRRGRRRKKKRGRKKKRWRKPKTQAFKNGWP